MKIDLHAHFYPRSYLDQLEPLRRQEPRVALGTESLIHWMRRDPRMWSVEQRLEDLERFSLDTQVLSLSTPNVYFTDRQAAIALCQVANDTFVEMARTHPERFRVFVSVPLHFPEEALRELDRVADAPEVVGVVLGANCNGAPLNRPDFMPFYEELERRGLPIFIHPMHPPGIEEMTEFRLSIIAGYLFDSTLAVLRLVFAGVFERYPRLTLIMPHLGAVAPYMMGRVQDAYARHAELRANIPRPPDDYFKRFYYDTVCRSVPSLRFACELYGSDHVVFGTDYPFWTDVAGIYQDVRDIGLSAEAEEGIFSGNALRILGGVVKS